jgi:hypothetical protein
MSMATYAKEGNSNLAQLRECRDDIELQKARLSALSFAYIDA